MNHFDVSHRIVPVIKKAVCCVLPVQEDKITVLWQGVGIWLVEVVEMSEVIVNVTLHKFDEGVLMIFVSSPSESTEDNNLMNTIQYEVSHLDSLVPAVRVIQ